MRVVVTGATGNVGTALLERLAAQPEVGSVVGVARRRPDVSVEPYRDAEWVTCDVSDPDAGPVLRKAVRGADAVVHLAWLIQPSHDLAVLRRTNLDGTHRVVEAAAAEGVGHVVHASSVGVYSPGPKDRAVGETWPRRGVPSSSYSRHKALTEQWLDQVEAREPGLVVTRMRPGLIFQGRAASEIQRYFIGRFAPLGLLRRVSPPVLPLPESFVFQVVHAGDVASAYWLALAGRHPGAFNVAGEPVIDPRTLAAALGARHLPVPVGAVRAAAAVAWRARLQPTAPGWVDLASSAPVMDTARAREVLGWVPAEDGETALRELFAGLAEGEGVPSGPLRPRGAFG